MMQINNVIIGGVHKAGTTSLYSYLSKHDEICPSEIKETHFFSGRTFPKKYMNYKSYFKINSKKHKFCLEASPEYIYGGEKTASKIFNELGEVRMIFILREPVSKIISSFNHRKKKLEFPIDFSFDDFKEKYFDTDCLENLNLDNGYAHELLEGSYIDYLPIWYSVFPQSSIKIIFFDNLISKPDEVILEILEWLNMDKTKYPIQKFEIENQSIIPLNPFFHKVAIQFYSLNERFFRRNHQLKSFIRWIYYKINVIKSDSNKMNMDNSKLSRLYKEKNQELASFLQQKGYSHLPEWLLDD